jgi:hypothetical protein
LDEFSIVAYWAGQYRESFNACLKLLKKGKMPVDFRQRILENGHFAIEKLKQPSLAKLFPPA